MTHTASVRVNVFVSLDPTDAFEVFTDEIDAWYKRGPHNFRDPSRALAVAFEPYVGGRLMEVYNRETGEGYEMARIIVWEPGRRLLFRDNSETDVEVTFVPEGQGTRVTLEHRGLEKLSPALANQKARFGGRLLFEWYIEFV